ncbi:MAG: hypothetical protein AB1330_11805 [Bacillota bacterium]
MLNQIVGEVEGVLGVSGEAIITEGLKRFLTAKIEENEKIMRELAARWGVADYLELEEKVRRGEVQEHPAWEDVILWEQLAGHTQKLKELLGRVEMGEGLGLP